MMPAAGCWSKDAVTACSRSSALVAGGVEVTQEGQGLASHRFLDWGELAHLGCAECLAEPGGLGVGAAAAPGLCQQGFELGEGQPGCCSGGGRGGQDDAGLSERGEEAGVVLAQVRAELVMRGGAVPDGILLGAG